MNRKISNLLNSTFVKGLLGSTMLILAGCSSSDSMNTVQVDRSASQYAQQVVNLGPKAQEACVSAGGLPSLNLELDGAQTAVCQFANGKRCAADVILTGSCI
ncbi:DUF333 domain-containing protein [Providencia vermicola]|uniref:DUF333 domain-containing protein n=1 Tax=Providencia TaxID=586 RepID=UPI0012B596FF|nr:MULTISPECIES: DUF333 domain-containing protein [unclassified Providencia]MTB40534.1 DUF333 domain-containing protein [Providencia sp. wls1949]MTC08506.1 DUF333 domain-containing protein [Providencia sp. wls1948]